MTSAHSQILHSTVRYLGSRTDGLYIEDPQLSKLLYVKPGVEHFTICLPTGILPLPVLPLIEHCHPTQGTLTRKQKQNKQQQKTGITSVTVADTLRTIFGPTPGVRVNI